MKLWIKFINWIRKFFKMMLPKTPDGKIDSSKVKKVCRHFNGVDYFYTAEINGVLTFLVYTNDLKNWLENSGIDVCDFSIIWESPIPDGRELVENENTPVTTAKSKKII